MGTAPKHLFSAHALQGIRRLVAHVDRNPASALHGAVNRDRWAWKVSDFTDGTYLGAIYPLALLHAGAVEGAAAWRGNDVLFEWISACFDYAARLQRRDGAFDMAYYGEGGPSPTGHVLYYFGAAFRLVGDVLPADTRGRVVQLLDRAADRLTRLPEAYGQITNHQAQYAAAMEFAAQRAGREDWRMHGATILRAILESQHVEGWFPEYGGADPSYQLLCLYYLDAYYRLRPTPELEQAILRGLEFCSHFDHPDGTYGGLYGSRATGLYYPAAPEAWADRSPAAASLAARMRRAVADGRTPTPVDVDLRNLIILCAMYLTAAQHAPAGEPPPQDPPARADFPGAGLFVRRTLNYTAVLGAARGGVLRVWDARSGARLLDDGGVLAETTDGAYWTTQRLGLSTWQADGEAVRVTADFGDAVRLRLTPWRMIVLRLLGVTVCRIPGFGAWLNRFLARMAISGTQRRPLQLERSVAFTETDVTVEDRLSGRGLGRLRRLIARRPFLAIHMGTAQYFEPADLQPHAHAFAWSATDATAPTLPPVRVPPAP